MYYVKRTTIHDFVDIVLGDKLYHDTYVFNYISFRVVLTICRAYTCSVNKTNLNRDVKTNAFQRCLESILT